MKNLPLYLKRKSNQIALVLTTASAIVATSAFAALPAEATAAFADLKDTGSEVMGLVWGIAVVVTGGFVALKLFKKGANKAT